MPNYEQLAKDNEKFSKYCNEHGITPGVIKVSQEEYEALLDMLYPDEPDSHTGRTGSEGKDDER